MEIDENPSIPTFFAGKTVFVTGGTGFLGKVLIEKLLRSCYDLKKIYVLVREKKGKSCEKRLEEFFGSALYDRLKLERGEALKKLCMVSGDCELENLGLRKEDCTLLVNEVEVIFHVAATVRFDEKLQKATYINVRATQDLLALSRQMQKLKSFVHVSTAFSFCPQPVIDERFYKVPLCASDLLTIVDNATEEHLDKITSIICKPWPNTYSFTKAIAEDVVRREAKDLPIAIVRPSVVIASIKEPVRGWIDNIYGPTGIFLGMSVGMVRTCVVQENYFADQVPVDYVVNNLIAAAWSLGKSLRLSQRYASEFPSVHMKWHIFFKHVSDMYTFSILHFFLHLVPAYIGDLILSIFGNKPILVKMYNKFEKNVALVSYFTLRQWIFKNNNNKRLFGMLSEQDKKNFSFNVKEIDWNSYAGSYVKGARTFLLKDALDTLPQARKKALRLKIIHYFVVAIFLYLLIRLFLNVFNVL
ncbi:hypothetical protein RN001_010624 [Aquatica leii]|uniref:Fatty acyl-CoA reductase n=1 Tax=Aquatica leii TaxID=1421715 RepID=A0AAN7QHL4_9COLE|nr:hypothetical protein RN001_010624 [Aquatica leii]